MPLPAGPVVGTCGFAYPEWRGRFYPPELGPGEWLGFYAQVFEALELDGTFYRPPEAGQVAVWAEALPDRFAVAAKVPRAITHEARLEGEAAAGMLRAFAQALEPFGDRLLAAVLQLPPSLDAGEGRDRLARLLEGRPDGLPVVVEVRHRSWDRPWLPALLAASGAGLVVAQRPGAAPWPAPAGPVGYLRLLGDRRDTPVIGRPVRDHAAELDRWAALLARAATAADGAALAGADRPGHPFGVPRTPPPVAAFVNNRVEGAAFDTAAALRRRLGQPAPAPRELWPAPPLPGLEP